MTQSQNISTRSVNKQTDPGVENEQFQIETCSFGFVCELLSAAPNNSYRGWYLVVS